MTRLPSDSSEVSEPLSSAFGLSLSWFAVTQRAQVTTLPILSLSAHRVEDGVEGLVPLSVVSGISDSLRYTSGPFVYITYFKIRFCRPSSLRAMQLMLAGSFSVGTSFWH